MNIKVYRQTQLENHDPFTWRSKKVSEQFTGALKVFQNRATKKLKAKLIQAVSEMMEKLMDLTKELAPGGGVTGNLANGWFIALYYNKKIVYVDYSSNHIGKPTRNTLRYKEAYNLPYYYNGKPVEHKPYVGDTGDKNYYSYDRAERIIKQFPRYIKSNKKGTFVAVVGNAVKYVSYLDRWREVNLHTELAGYARQLGLQIRFQNGITD